MLAILHDQATIWRAEVPAVELEFLNAAAGFLDGLAGVLNKAQSAAAKRAKERDAQAVAEHRAALKAATAEIFCAGHDAAQILAVASDLLAFEKGMPELATAKRAGCAYCFNFGSYDLQQAIAKGNATRAAEIVAEAKLAASKQGERHADRDGKTSYFAGWADFVAFQNQRAAIGWLSTNNHGNC